MGFFKCECGREQAHAASGESGGVTTKEAESLGWVLINGKWVCPVCNPAFAKINLEVFVRDFVSGERTSCGKYQTCVENYTLCVDVSKNVIPELFRIEIEFSGKVQP